MGFGPQLNVTEPPLLSAATNAVSEQLSGEPVPTTPAAWVGSTLARSPHTIDARARANEVPRVMERMIGSLNIGFAVIVISQDAAEIVHYRQKIPGGKRGSISRPESLEAYCCLHMSRQPMRSKSRKSTKAQVKGEVMKGRTIEGALANRKPSEILKSRRL